MALRFGVISVDDHVVEVPDLWVQGMSQAFKKLAEIETKKINAAYRRGLSEALPA